MYDILILGAGPAGLSAAVAARQKNKSVLIISNPIHTNPLYRAEQVDNYLGLPAQTGAALLETSLSHALNMGAQLRVGRVLSAMALGDVIYLTVGSDVVEGKRLILASGITRGRKYPGEERLLGKGVSYCATCDGMFYRNRPVVVVGRSEDAPMEANYLASIGCAVTYVSPKTPSRLREDIPFVRGGKIELQGEGQLTGVIVEGALIPCDGAFILREAVAPAELFADLKTEAGFICVDRFMRTNLPGVFAAGDCTGHPLQVAKAVGEGLIAADTAANELNNKT